MLREQGGGVGLCAFVDGRMVCDLWGGTVGEEGLVHTWSVVKPVTAACLLLLVDRGHVTLDTSVGGCGPSSSPPRTAGSWWVTCSVTEPASSRCRTVRSPG